MVFPLLPYYTTSEVDENLPVVGQAIYEFNGSNAESIISISKNSKLDIYVNLKINEINDSIIDSILSLYNNGIVSIFANLDESTAIIEKFQMLELHQKFQKLKFHQVIQQLHILI